MHLQTADNNMNPLKVPTEFATVYAGQEAFSTIDHEYDPILPICMTDRANLITVHNFNEIAGFMERRHYKLTYSSTNIKATYAHKDHVIIPVGIVKALGYDNLYIHYKKSAGKGLVYDSSTGVIAHDPDATNVTNGVIDIVVSKEASLTDYTLLATVAANFAHDVIYSQPKVQDGTGGTVTKSELEEEVLDVIYFKDAGPYSYAYSDLRNNYIIDVKHPLINGIIEYINNAVGAKFRSLLGGRHEL
jgi:hypothetical protein